MFWQIGSIGPGLSNAELQSAATHTNALQTLKEPLYPLFSKLQVFSLKIFGINTYSIRIPSIIIALATLLLLYQILKKWFGKPTALLSVALIATADWFLFATRLANGGIELSFWFVVALFSLVKIIEHKNIYSLALVTSLTTLLFIPFGPYLSISLTVGILTCRVIRDRVLEAPKIRRVLLVLIPLIGMGIFVYTIFQNPEFFKTILGIQADLPNVAQYVQNVLVNGGSVVAILPATNPLNGPSGVFIIRFFELTFVLFGLFMFWKTRINRLNLIVMASALTLLIASGLSSDSPASSLLIVPCAIFMTAGLRYFIHRWQKTFPKNPYARLAAIVPILTLLLLTAILHQQIYFKLWPHQTTTANVYSYDLQLAQSELNSKPVDTKCMVITADQSVATLLQASKLKCDTSFQTNVTPIEDDTVQIIQATLLGSKISSSKTSSRALTQSSSEQSTRWIVRSITQTN